LFLSEASFTLTLFYSLMFISFVLFVHNYKKQDELNLIKLFPIFFFIVVYLVSGVIHLANLSGRGRGPIDLLTTNESGLILQTTVVILLAYFSMILGLKGYSRIPSPSTSRFEREFLHSRYFLIIGGAAIVVGAYSFLRIKPLLASLDSKRIISIDGGLARYAFTTSWLTWGFILVAFYFLAKTTSKRLGILILFLTVIGVQYSTSWNGSRSSIFLVCAPLIYNWMRQSRIHSKSKFIIALLIGIAYAFYTKGILEDRISNEGARNFSLISLLDWEIGRFSSLGRTISITTDNGFELGETFLATLSSFANGILRVIGYSEMNLGQSFSSVQQIIGGIVLGNREKIYLVPGFVAEMYLNFGLLGTILGYFLFGALIRFFVRKLSHSIELYEQVYWSYLILAVSFNITLNSSSGLIGQTIIDVAPLHILMILMKIKKSRHKSFLKQDHSND
jgi:oligosaccharide repeat unit polymerase